jgi:hypothetical protein
MSVSYGGDKITFDDGSTVSSGWAGFKNRIINGAMVVDQRASASSPITSGSRAYAVDRWCCEKSGAGAFTLGQSTTAPTGFKYSLLATVTTADTSIASGDIYWLEHRIEGFNMADLEWGTANAKTVTLSFWVRSNLTGTYSVCPTTGSSRTFDYTINSADTWEYKTIVITGPGTGVGYNGSTTNGTGINLRFALAVGSTYAQAPSAGWVSGDEVGSTNQVNWMNTLSNNFYITGVQFELGSSASSFEYRPFGAELQLCQRYYVNMNGVTNNYQPLFFGTLYNTTSGTYIMNLPVPMRTVPAITSSGTIYAQNLSINLSSLAGPYSQIGSLLEGDFTLASSSTSGNFVLARWNNIAVGSRSFNISAEL